MGYFRFIDRNDLSQISTYCSIRYVSVFYINDKCKYYVFRNLFFTFFDIEIFRIDLKNKLVDNFRGMET